MPFHSYGNNFGDEIGPLVSKKLVEDHFNCKGDSLPVWNLAKKGARKGTCLFSLGSIFHMVKEGDHIWGTGVNPTWQRQVPDNLNIHAVRGPRTEDFLKARGVIKESVGHGDPGLLLPLMFPVSMNRENENSVLLCCPCSGQRYCQRASNPEGSSFASSTCDTRTGSFTTSCRKPPHMQPHCIYFSTWLDSCRCLWNTISVVSVPQKQDREDRGTFQISRLLLDNRKGQCHPCRNL